MFRWVFSVDPLSSTSPRIQIEKTNKMKQLDSFMVNFGSCFWTALKYSSKKIFHCWFNFEIVNRKGLLWLHDIHTSKLTEKCFLSYLFCKDLFIFVYMGILSTSLVYHVYAACGWHESSDTGIPGTMWVLRSSGRAAASSLNCWEITSEPLI